MKNEIDVNEHLKKTILTAVERFQAEISYFRDQVTLIVKPAQINDVLRLLRDEFDFPMLMDITAVDFLTREPRFDVVYQLKGLSHNDRLTLRIPVGGEMPRLSSIEAIFPGANWYEREVFDMFGIEFTGHPYLKRIIMPTDWQGYPLRKDYPLGYEEVEFTFNFDDIDSRKPKGKEFLAEN